MNRIILPALGAASLGAAVAQAQSLPPSSAPAKDAETVKLDSVVVVADSSERSNNLLNADVQAATSPAASAVDYLQHLPGVLINQGDAYGGDDWSTRIYVRGFQAGQLGFSVDGIPNGATNYGGGTKPNRFVDPENLSMVTVSQGSGNITAAGAQSLGGSFDYATIAPAEKAGLFSAFSTGDNQLNRIFVRYNTGAIGGNTHAFVSFSRQTHHRWMDTGSEAGITERTHVDAKSVSTFGKLAVTARFSYDDIFEPNYDSGTLADYASTPKWDGLTGEWTGNPNVDQNYIKGWNTIRENYLGAVEFSLQASDDLKFSAEPYWQHQKGSGGWLPPYLRMGWTAAGQSTNNASFAATQARAFFQDAQGNLLPVYVSGPRPTGVTFYTPTNPFDINSYPEAVRAGAVPVASYRTSTYLFDRIGTTFGGDWKINSMNRLQVGGWYENLHREPGRTWQKLVDARVGWDSDARSYWSDFLSDLKTDTLSLYVQDTVTLGSLSVSGGLRQYYVDLKYKDQYGVRPSRSLGSDSDLLPSAGAIYRLGENLGEVFGGYSKNFKAIEDNIVASTSEISKSLEPETSDSIDFGYRLNRGTFSGSVSGYFIDFNNRIESVTPLTNGGVTNINYDIGQGGGYVNVGGIRSKGVEIALSNAISRQFGTNVSLTLNQSEYTKSIPENNVVEGNKVTGSPEAMVSGSVFFKEGPYRLSLTGKYTGERVGTLDNKEKIGGFTLFDASVGYHKAFPAGSWIGALSVDLRIQNLFDKDYLAGLDGDANATEGYYFVGAPRTTSLTVGVEF